MAPNQSPQSSRKLASGLLICCLLALILGLFNAVRISQETADTHSGKKKSVGSMLGKSNRLELLNLTGAISMDPSTEGGIFKNDSNAMQVKEALNDAAKDNSIKGILLRINSPGGTVAMSQELNEAVKRVREKKPVVVSMGDLAASGGYYTACAADEIVANPGTLTASIGVIISTLNFTTLMNDKLGVEALTIKSGKFKDILSPYRKPTADDKALLQKLIDDSYADFLGAVIDGRTRLMTDPAKKAARIAIIKSVADGRVVTGRQGLADGLVDDIGDQDAAYTILDTLAKKRFNLSGTDRLSLDEADNGFNLMSALGLTSSSSSVGAPANPLAAVSKLMPFSMHYPNQPLWILE